MIVLKLSGGLGNQMFQYAFAKKLETLGFIVKIDLIAFEKSNLHGGYQLDFYKIEMLKVKNKERSYLNSNSYLIRFLRKFGIEMSPALREKSLLFNEDFFKIKGEEYIEGHFQSEKYFKSIRGVLLKHFVISQKLSKYTQSIEKKILESKNSCSIHVRRGDFINKVNKNIHGACSFPYYKKAVEYIQNKVGVVNHFIFSDDISWVKENLILENATYITSETPRIPHEDIYLMSLCSHNIIANSSFSWWGAWLNQNSNKIVMAPKKWFENKKLQENSKDIFCESWKKI
jgi:hypothetical protein